MVAGIIESPHWPTVSPVTMDHEVADDLDLEEWEEEDEWEDESENEVENDYEEDTETSLEGID
jgi:hypothetical protein